MLYPLGLVEFRWGDKQLMLFQHHENGGFLDAVGYQKLTWSVA
jgi:hypothetical protein